MLECTSSYFKLLVGPFGGAKYAQVRSSIFSSTKVNHPEPARIAHICVYCIPYATNRRPPRCTGRIASTLRMVLRVLIAIWAVGPETIDRSEMHGMSFDSYTSIPTFRSPRLWRALIGRVAYSLDATQFARAISGYMYGSMSVVTLLYL